MTHYFEHLKEGIWYPAGKDKWTAYPLGRQEFEHTVFVGHVIFDPAHELNPWRLVGPPLDNSGKMTVARFPTKEAVKAYGEVFCDLYRKIWGENIIPRKERPWQCRWFGCDTKGQPEFVGIHSSLKMGCHKSNCRRCGQTHERIPA